MASDEKVVTLTQRELSELIEGRIARERRKHAQQQQRLLDELAAVHALLDRLELERLAPPPRPRFGTRLRRWVMDIFRRRTP
jgi:hypothetical protein